MHVHVPNDSKKKKSLHESNLMAVKSLKLIHKLVSDLD